MNDETRGHPQDHRTPFLLREVMLPSWLTVILLIGYGVVTVKAITIMGVAWYVAMIAVGFVIWFLIIPLFKRWLVKKGFVEKRQADPQSNLWNELRTQPVWLLTLQALGVVFLGLVYLNII